MHLNISASVTAWDTWLDEQIQACREHIERKTTRAFCTQTISEYFDAFPVDDCFYLSVYPVASITHVKYTDSDGDQQTWDSSNYATDLVSRHARIELKSTGTLPTNLDGINSIEVEYIAGYGAPSAVPARFKTAIKLLLGELYENRENRAYTLPDRIDKFLFQDMDWEF